MRDDPTPAQDVASGGPLDGDVLGAAGPERYEVRMADGTTHVYDRLGPPGSRRYQYAGRR